MPPPTQMMLFFLHRLTGFCCGTTWSWMKMIFPVTTGIVLIRRGKLMFVWLLSMASLLILRLLVVFLISNANCVYMANDEDLINFNTHFPGCVAEDVANTSKNHFHKGISVRRHFVFCVRQKNTIFNYFYALA